MSKSYLYEGLNSVDTKSMMLWESAGQSIAEAQLTPQQITQLFQQIEQGATAAGGNRTLIGKGKDVASAVNKAYQDLKGKVENSATMQYFDQKYEEAAAKLKQATGGDAGVMKYVEKYRSFAKKHPVAQSLIYGALIAAAGISGAGAGGAAALGLLKMTDKLLQGEKFSKAAIAGAETGALAYGASKLGDLVKNAFNPVTQTREVSWESIGNGITQANIGPGGEVVGDILYNNQLFRPGDPGYAQVAKEIVATAKADGLLGGFGDAADAAKTAARNAMAGSTFESVKLSNDQVTQLFEAIVIEAGLWDKFKTNVLGEPEEREEVKQQFKQGVATVAGAIGQQARRIGTNLTTKITADKLQKAWKAAGSPTDSDQIIKMLQAQGIDQDVINGAVKTVSATYSPEQKFDWVAKLTPDQRQQMIVQIKKMLHTGGRVAGQVSQTPGAIRQRQARAAAKQAPVAESMWQQELNQLLNR